MGLVERPWSTERRGNPPSFIFAQSGEEAFLAEKDPHLLQLSYSPVTFFLFLRPFNRIIQKDVKPAL